ncbi:MAG TPA: transcriptional repressor LexA [Thermodesulfobacteriota bacterium]|jgi:repressor LexA
MIERVLLTERQQDILDFIASQIESLGFPPTISEIQKQFSFKSPNAAGQHLKALVKKGWIKRHPHKSRGIEVTDTSKGKEKNGRPNTVAVPLVGRISAGSPLLAEENIETTIGVDKSLVHRYGRLFALTVHGDSMIKAGIYQGDIVIAHQQSMAENGDIVIALLGDEATVKRFFRRDGAVVLQPENDTMQPIKVLPREDFRVLGKVIANLRKIS